jgi:hypothetical protein
VIRVPLPKIQGLHLRTTSGISPANELVRFEAGRGVWTFTLRVTPPSGAVESLEALLAYDAWPFDARDVRGVNLAPTCLTVSAGDVLLAATGFRLATRHPGDGSVNHPWGSERSINNVYYFSKLPHDQTGAISAPWQPSSRSIGTTDEDRAVSQTCGRK